jgi:hypothetical protein
MVIKAVLDVDVLFSAVPTVRRRELHSVSLRSNFRLKKSVLFLSGHPPQIRNFMKP